jgi:hypothetical protein
MGRGGEGAGQHRDGGRGGGGLRRGLYERRKEEGICGRIREKECTKKKDKKGKRKVKRMLVIQIGKMTEKDRVEQGWFKKEKIERKKGGVDK